MSRVESRDPLHGPDLLRELLWEAINRYSANRADLNARSQAAARINELFDVMLRVKR